MERKSNARTWKCRNCQFEKSKKEFIKKTVAWFPVFICKHCGYQNWESIFIKWIPVKKQELIFWQPIKWTKK
jgi:transcription elongation factor Elf1